MTSFADAINNAIAENDADPEIGLKNDSGYGANQGLPEGHWINLPIEGEDDKTLLMMAIEMQLYDFMEVS